MVNDRSTVKTIICSLTAIFTIDFSHSKSHGQCHSYFDCEYLVYDERYSKHYNCDQICSFRLAYLRLKLAHHKCQGHANLYCDYIINVLLSVKHCYPYILLSLRQCYQYSPVT